MFLTLKRADEEPQEYVFNPGKVSVFEAESIEKRTDWTFQQFQAELHKGSARAMRVALWVCQRRQHPTLRLEDVTFDMGELELEFNASELARMREAVAGVSAVQMDPDEKMATLAQFDELLKAAREDPDGPKAKSGN